MIRVCHGSLGLRARTCQGVWSRGETGLPAWGKAGERGAWSRSTEDNPTPVARPCSSEGFQRHPPGVPLWAPPSGWGPVLLATCSKIRDMRSNSIRRKCPSKKGRSGSWGSSGVRTRGQPQGLTRELHSWNWSRKEG